MAESANPAVANLTASLAAISAEVKAMTDKWQGKEADMPVAEVEALTARLGKIDELKARIDVFRRADAERLGEKEPAEPPLAWRKAGPSEGDFAVDAKSWREIEIKSSRGETQLVRYYVPLAVTKKGYGKAFEAYLRFGAEYSKVTYPNDYKALNEGVDTAGGFLVPEDYLPQLIKKIATNAMVRPNATVITTSRDVVNMPRVNYTTDDKYTSGVRLTWTGETPASGSVHRVTDQVYGQISIPVHTAMASQLISNNLIEDNAYDLMGHSSDLFGEAFALGEDDAFLNGNGTNRPMGLLTEVGGNGPASIVSGTSAAISTSGDAHSGVRIINLYYELPAQYRGMAMWLTNSGVAKEMDNLVDGQKRPIVHALTQASLESGEINVIKGRPLAIDEFVPPLAANSYSLIFGDFKGYMIVDRVGFSLQRFTERYAEENQTLLLARRRVGGYCTQPFRFKVLKAST